MNDARAGTKREQIGGGGRAASAVTADGGMG